MGGGKTGAKKLVAKRHIRRNTIAGITKPAVRRLARRGGIKRISSEVYDATRERLKEYLGQMIGRAIVYMDYARRKTVTANDVVYACKSTGQPIYGFGQ